MLMCGDGVDGCDQGFHIYCLTPKLKKIPEDDWFCQVLICGIHIKFYMFQSFIGPHACGRPQLTHTNHPIIQTSPFNFTFTFNFVPGVLGCLFPLHHPQRLLVGIIITVIVLELSGQA